LAIEVLSPSNTRREMQRKLREYFDAGVECVWLIDPRTQTAKIYTAPKVAEEVSETGVLRANEVLPGFELPLRELFRRAQLRPEP
jgi:Uma2 family endonuclease